MFKHLGLYEMILETIFKHWILVLGTPERCPALEQFLFFFFYSSYEHSTPHHTLSSLQVLAVATSSGQPSVLHKTLEYGTPPMWGLWVHPLVHGGGNSRVSVFRKSRILY